MRKGHDYVLVTGLPGVGKTHLAKYFRAHGANAYDADDVKRLGRWVDSRGRYVTYVESKVNADWLSKNQYIWSRKVMRGLLGRSPRIYLFGSASNMYGLLGLFDRAYYLKADSGLIGRRLQSKDRANRFGTSREQRKLIQSWVEYSDTRAQEEGLSFVDASLAAKRIFEIISRR